MKTKTSSFGKAFLSKKRFVEIAVVLCSVFLVATLPAIAADGTQKVSTSAITTASEEDDYTLGIYGNANEDDTIDMRDVTYTKLIIFGERDKTELSNAKYDERINVLDVIQEKLIILGRESELTLVDSADKITTIEKPLERIAMLNGDCMPVMRALDASDKIVAVNKYTIQDELLYPEFHEYPNIGSIWSPNYEEILESNPDAVMLYGTIFESYNEEVEDKLKGTGIQFLRFDGYKPGSDGYHHVEEAKKLGYILGKTEEAGEWIDFYLGVLNPIKEKTSDIERKTVYLECWHPYHTAAKGAGWHQKLEIAGGENIFGNRTGYIDVDPEEVIRRDPEAIIVNTRKGGYTGSVSELKDLRGDFLDTEDPDYRPELFNVTAVKNEEVYVITSEIYGGTEHFIGITYIAKWLYPDMFSDLDPEAIHKQYLTEFQGLENGDSLVDNGVFVYPEPS